MVGDVGSPDLLASPASVATDAPLGDAHVTRDDGLHSVLVPFEGALQRPSAVGIGVQLRLPCLVDLLGRWSMVRLVPILRTTLV